MVGGVSAPRPAVAEPPAILLVDDDASMRVAIRAMLAPLGHVVVEAGSGRAALRAVARQPFAVIVMDVRMPALDGYETAKLLREGDAAASTPIIFVTAPGPEETEPDTAHDSGAVDFIFTPIHAGQLRAKVSAFVTLFLQAQQLQSSLESITALNVALHASEIRARAVLQHVADGIFTAGEGGLIESFNESAQRLFGYSEAEIVGQPLQLILAPSHRDGFFYPGLAMWTLPAASDVSSQRTETVGARKDGSCFPIEMDLSEMRIAERTFTVGCIRDISGRKAYTDALERRALHDDLTGLPNRTLFGDRVDRALASAGRASEARAVLIIDIDRFREFNTRHGREHGDVVLGEVADRLRGAMGDLHTVALVGDDEFGILPSTPTGVVQAAVVAWNVRQIFERPFVVGGDAINLAASIGIAFYPQHGRTAGDLLRRAELAMYQAKRSSSGLSVYVADPADQTARRLSLLDELRDGIPRGELVLHYQPKIDLATRRSTGVEALVRWQHPTDGLLMPAQFIPEAEASELIEPLTDWVLAAALRQQRRWIDAGLDLTMAVNVSAHTLTPGSDLPATVAKLTGDWGISSDKLVLELTESAIFNPDVPEVLDHLHAMGEVLAIDDFGTGHSSLVYLQRLPIDEIKIDRSFVMQLATAAADAVIVRSTIELAHNLGLKVVAEGVEDEIALEKLIDYGCDSAQGYYFSRPQPAHTLTQWLNQSPFGTSARSRLQHSTASRSLLRRD